MNELTQQIKRISRLLIVALVISMLGWMLTPYSAFFAGLVLGFIIGLISTLYTAFKVQRISDAVAQGRGRAGTGMATRFGLVVMGTVAVLKFPEHFNMVSFVVALFLTQVFAVGDAIFSHKNNNA